MDFVKALQNTQNFTHTENGAGTYSSSMSGVLDLFGLGGAYRTRTDRDCIKLFNTAWDENRDLALKCLFYLRDVRGGQGERRFFRTVLHNLAITNPEVVRKNIRNIPEYGRWDDLYCLMDTPVEKDAFEFIGKQLSLDMSCKTPSLLAKWLKSENTSSKESRALGYKTRVALGLTARTYRKMLSKLRANINVLERLMSAQRWDEIEFDKIPSRAGLIYKNAFARHDVERYKAFAEDKNTKVNAKALYPYEVIHKVREFSRYNIKSTDRLMLDKYWEGLADYIHNASFNGIVVADVSGSMYGTPIEVAISLALMCAEKCSGPYHNHFLTFSRNPKLQAVIGDDIYDKVWNLDRADWDMNTDIEALFDLVLETAVMNCAKQEDIPGTLIIVSDMEFDSCCYGSNRVETLMETMERKWLRAGYKLPSLVFWNVSARNDRIPMKVQNGVTLVSGFSSVLFEQIIKGKTAWDLVLDKLLSERYKAVVA